MSRAIGVSLEPLEDRATPSTFLVTNALDPSGRIAPGSLRWAISQANQPANVGSTVEITPSVQGPITLQAGELRISSGMTIVNNSGSPLDIRQATPASRIFNVLNNSRTNQVTIAGNGANNALTLTGGFAQNANGGGILVQNPNNILTLSYVNVVGNAAAQVRNPSHGVRGNGGGIYSSGTVTLDHSNVSFNAASGQNSAAGHAGGVYTDLGIVMVASHVDGNIGQNAGGVFNVTGAVDVLAGSTVNQNRSTANAFLGGSLGGGGIGQMNGNVIVSHSQVNDNQTVGMYSGGIVLLTGGVTVTDGSQVNGNTNNGPGGGIAANFGGPVIISNGSQVDGNTGAGLGGGIVNFAESFGITVTGNSEVSGNKLTNAEDAAVTGGLIKVFQSAPVRNAFLSGGRGDAALEAALQLFANMCGQRAGVINAALQAFPSGGSGQVGGGIASPLGGPIVISGNSTISGNKFTTAPHAMFAARGDGGGLFGNLGPITVTDSTISGNNASNDGGGVWNGALLTVTNSAITGNTATVQGGGVFNQGAFVSTNSTISGNHPDDVFPPA